MADVQPDRGCVPVAHDLYLAIDRMKQSALERRTLSAVMYFTYGSGKSKSEISAEDIRYYLGADKELRTAHVEDAITKLIGRKILFRQELVNGKQLLGIQKDYEQWLDKPPTLETGKNPATLQDKSIYTDTLTSMVPGKNPDTVARLLDYVQIKSKFKYGVTAWRVERKAARLLYQDVLARVRNGSEAFDLICDFVDEHEWMRLNVKMQFTFMSSRFEAWRSQIPRKPREVREDEESLGRTYRYDVKTKHWVWRESRMEVMNG